MYTFFHASRKQRVKFISRHGHKIPFEFNNRINGKFRMVCTPKTKGIDTFIVPLQSCKACSLAEKFRFFSGNHGCSIVNCVILNTSEKKLLDCLHIVPNKNKIRYHKNVYLCRFYSLGVVEAGGGGAKCTYLTLYKDHTGAHRGREAYREGPGQYKFDV